MSAELTPETVSLAIEEGIRGDMRHPHPVIKLGLDSKFSRIRRGAANIHNSRRAANFAQTNFEGEVLQKIELANKFPLQPLDIIGIWAGTRNATYEQKTSLARSLTANYSLRNDIYISMGASWPEITRSHVKTGRLPDSVLDNPEDLKHFQAKTADIQASLREITVYVYGTDIPNDMREVLLAAAVSGDIQAVNALDKFYERERARLNPTVAGVLKEFAPEVSRFQRYVDNALWLINPQLNLLDLSNQ